MKRFSKAQALLATAVGVVLLAGGLATASNMGFKFVPNIGSSQFFNLGLPWNNNYTNAQSLLADFGGNAESVTRYNTNGSLTAWFSGASAANNFNLTLGMGVIAKGGSGGTGYAWPHY
jgi:hypothetical protein